MVRQCNGHAGPRHWALKSLSFSCWPDISPYGSTICPIKCLLRAWIVGDIVGNRRGERSLMFGALQVFPLPLASGLRSLLALTSALLVAGCSGKLGDLLSPSSSPSAPSQPATSIGSGGVKVGLILPLSGSGNAAVAAKSMRNAAEMALAEFNSPDIQLRIKDDGGSATGAQQ